MHLSAFTGFGNVSRSTIWGHITFFAMIFFWPSWRPPKVQIANFLEPTKKNKKKLRGTTFRLYLIINMQSLNDFRSLVWSKEFNVCDKLC